MSFQNDQDESSTDCVWYVGFLWSSDQVLTFVLHVHVHVWANLSVKEVKIVFIHLLNIFIPRLKINDPENNLTLQ